MCCMPCATCCVCSVPCAVCCVSHIRTNTCVCTLLPPQVLITDPDFWGPFLVIMLYASLIVWGQFKVRERLGPERLTVLGRRGGVVWCFPPQYSLYVVPGRPSRYTFRLIFDSFFRLILQTHSSDSSSPGHFLDPSHLALRLLACLLRRACPRERRRNVLVRTGRHRVFRASPHRRRVHLDRIRGIGGQPAMALDYRPRRR